MYKQQTVYVIATDKKGHKFRQQVVINESNEIVQPKGPAATDKLYGKFKAGNVRSNFSIEEGVVCS